MSTLISKNKHKRIALALLALGLGTSILGAGGCAGSAEAAAPAPAKAASAATAGGSITDDGSSLWLESGSYSEGYRLGNRNGAILVNRLKQRTTDLEGCAAVDDLESALLKVSRSLKPTLSGSDALVAGFYSGYLGAVRSAIGTVRLGCGESSYESGEFAGELYGAIACQIQSVSVSAISSLELAPLYDGWSGGSSEVQASCRSTLLATLESCTSGEDLVTSINATLQMTCSDSSELSWL